MSDLEFDFAWRWPWRLVRVTAADHQGFLQFVPNRYGRALIGVAMYSGHKGLSLLWGRPCNARQVNR